MKRVLVICPKYGTADSSPYLTNELITELRCQKFKVDVVAFGEESLKKTGDGNIDSVIGIKSSLRIFKYVFLWPSLFFVLLNIRLRKRNYDYMIQFAPLTVMLPATLISLTFPIAKRICIVFDIFPLHQVKIGVLPSFSHDILHRVECFLMKYFNCITAMGPRNQSVISSYYKLPKTEVKVVPIWGVKRCDDNNRKKMVQKGAIKVVFGGQVIPGRRLDKLIDFLKIIRDRNVEIELTIFSKGPYFESLKKNYNAESLWVHFLSSIPRDEYISTISLFDVGAIVTDELVPLPTFPSKIIDYISAGLHCFCMVEDQSDLEEVIGDSSFVHINHFKYDEKCVDCAVKFFMNIKSESNTEETDRLIELFSVKRAAAEIIF